MVIVLEHDISEQQKADLREFLSGQGFQVHEVVGEEETIFGVVGQASIDPREVETRPGVARVVPISKPFKLASREFKRMDSVFSVGPVKIGGNRLAVIAGPCAVESREQIMEAAAIVRAAGGVMLRGGAWKPRTSPYSFQGLGDQGLSLLKEAGEAQGLPVVSEIVSPEHVDRMRDRVDVFQVGARNMQNFELLKAVGATGHAVMLKRGLSATIEEWLMAAEYLLAHGSTDIILCERGIRTFETYTRNSLDISSIPVVKKLSHLPVFVDPSHATGIRDKVLPVGLAAIAAGADGLLVEVHPNPEAALSDGPQSLFPEQLEKLMRDLEALSPVVGRELARIPRTRPPASAIAAGPVDSQSVADLAAGGSGAGSTADRGGLRVAFQGARGAFSEVALLGYFGGTEEVPEPQSRPHFRDVFDSVLSGETDYGIVPLENTLIGSIHENYDLFVQYPDVQIVGETHIRIQHSLIGTPEASIEGIRTVLSQAPGIDQCRDFLDGFPHWQVEPFFDTAGAVAEVRRRADSSVAAIAHAGAAAHYGMQVLKEGIETNPRNYTRFGVLGRTGTDAPDGSEPSMASLVFSTPDRPGALFECMRILAERKLNLQKLESRPILGEPWRYRFYVDVQLQENPDAFAVGYADLEAVTRDLRLIGTYRGSRLFEPG